MTPRRKIRTRFPYLALSPDSRATISRLLAVLERLALTSRTQHLPRLQVQRVRHLPILCCFPLLSLAFSVDSLFASHAQPPVRPRESGRDISLRGGASDANNDDQPAPFVPPPHTPVYAPLNRTIETVRWMDYNREMMWRSLRRADDMLTGFRRQVDASPEEWSDLRATLSREAQALFGVPPASWTVEHEHPGSLIRKVALWV